MPEINPLGQKFNQQTVIFRTICHISGENWDVLVKMEISEPGVLAVNTPIFTPNLEIGVLKLKTFI